MEKELLCLILNSKLYLLFYNFKVIILLIEEHYKITHHLFSETKQIYPGAALNG